MKHLLLVFALAISSLSTVAQTNSIQLRNGSNSLILAAPSGGAGGNYVLLLPASNGTNGQVLSTNGSGTLSWTTITSGATNLDGLSDAKVEGLQFTGSMILGHQTTGSLSAADNNTAIGIGAMDAITSGIDNTVLGFEAATSLTSGEYNVAIGSLAGTTMTTSVENTLVGFSSGYIISDGSYNAALGSSSLYSLTSGSWNVAVGYSAGYTFGTTQYSIALGAETFNNKPTGGEVGNYNIAIGSKALYNGTTGANNVMIGSNVGTGGANNSSTRNVVIGHNAGNTMTSGMQNVFVGYEAGKNIGAGFGNVFIGYQVGSSATLSDGGNILAIDNSSTTTPLIQGNFNLDMLTFNGIVTTTGESFLKNTVTIGGNAAASALRFREPSADGSNYTAFKAQAQGADVTYTLPAADGTSGQALTTNGSGTLSWGSIASSLDGLSDAKVEGDQFTGSMILGHQTTGTLSGATYNTAVGLNALKSITSGTSNTALGYQSLQQVTTASSNIAIGYLAGQSITTGSTNVAIGAHALKTSTDAYSNVVIGSYASQGATGAGYNVVIGYDAAIGQTTASSNVLVGHGAAGLLTTGGYNVFVGPTAGNGITTGSSNICIGASSGPGSNVSNKLYIDNSTTVTPLIYGDFSSDALTFNGTTTTTGNLTIGGTSTAAELRILEDSDDGSNYTAFKAQAQAANVTYTLPAADGTSGYVMTTNGSGTLSWSNVGSTYRYRALATNDNATTTDYTINVNASTSGTGLYTVTLPTAVGIAGRVYVIRKSDNSANAVKVDADGTETINGSLTIDLTSHYGCVTLQSDGANWMIIAAFSYP